MEGTSRSDLKITYWDVIDVLGEKNGVERPRCFTCAKPAMWQCSGKFACTKHCPKIVAFTKSALAKKTIPELTILYNQHRTNPPTKKGELIAALVEVYKTIGWSKFAGGASIKHAPVLDLAADIATCLDNRPWWEGTDLVVIENQKDRRMFAVQAMIHMYFAMTGFRVKGVSAVHKLNNIMTLDSTTTYKARKKTGIVHAEQLIPTSNRAFFRSHKKKDDLADSFLQGLWFLEH